MLPFLDRIANMPQMPLHRLVHDLVVGHGGLQGHIPVDQALAAVDQAGFEELEEGVVDRPGADFVQREARARPVAGKTHLAKLADDALVVLLFPLPDALFQERSVLGILRVADPTLLGPQALLHHRLRGDACVVGAGHPLRRVAAHAPPADQDVLAGVVERVAQVQRAGDVGRRDDDGVRFAIRIRLAMEVALLFPEAVPAVLGRGVIVLLGQFVG
jgi:hypothetical protein